MSDEFKFQFYFNLYKDKPLSNRSEFRIMFEKKHGKFDYINDLIREIEKYQINKYGSTLYDYQMNENRYEANLIATEKERNYLEKNWRWNL